MDHREALNLLLANTCPSLVPDETSGHYEFRLDLCCTEALVKAKLASTEGSIQYEITSVDIG